MQIFCLMGPTAVGKTELAIALAERFPVDIISVDSAMVYRGMDIGTAKPSTAVLQAVPHRLINICGPTEVYSAAQFNQDALREITNSLANARIPLLVGGTMMYFRALQKGLADMPSADPALRQELAMEGERLGWPALHERLAKIDSCAAARIHPHDRQRIQRALEVYLLTGKALTTWQSEQTERIVSNEHMINLIVVPDDRAILHERIAKRFKAMLAEGFIDEVRSLFFRDDLNLTLPALRTVGYRQIWEHLQGKMDFETMQNKAIIATCQLAKRQLTWLRQWPQASRFSAESKTLFSEVSAAISAQEGV